MATLTSNEQKNLEMAEKMIAKPLWLKILPGAFLAAVIFLFNFFTGDSIWRAIISSLIVGLVATVATNIIYTWTRNRILKKRDSPEQK